MLVGNSEIKKINGHYSKRAILTALIETPENWEGIESLTLDETSVKTTKNGVKFVVDHASGWSFDVEIKVWNKIYITGKGLNRDIFNSLNTFKDLVFVGFDKAMKAVEKLEKPIELKEVAIDYVARFSWWKIIKSLLRDGFSEDLMLLSNSELNTYIAEKLHPDYRADLDKRIKYLF